MEVEPFDQGNVAITVGVQIANHQIPQPLVGTSQTEAPSVTLTPPSLVAHGVDDQAKVVVLQHPVAIDVQKLEDVEKLIFLEV